VLLTGGMQERNAVNLDDVAATLADTADLHPREWSTSSAPRS
jgi:hypothetical protein